MKATLEFNLPDEKEEFETATRAGRYVSALWHIGQNLRQKIKHGQLTEQEYKVYEEVRDMFWGALRDEGVDEDF
jgi:hypothetical protein